MVAKRLEEDDLIRSRYLLLGLSKLQGTGSAIKAGYYRIEPGMSTSDIHDLLIKGTQTLYKVTIPEGLTSREIADTFEKAGICESENFVEAVNTPRVQALMEKTSIVLPEEKVLENGLGGFLFPDTYYFQRNYPAQKVVTHMVETFFRSLDDLAPSYRELEPKELYRKVILASVVEGEYRAAEEAPKIASVFYNRLDRGMKLQSCATVVYVLTEERGEEQPKKLTFEDLEVDSKFNTYTNEGLPPAPISNPGRIALDAAFHPAETDYLYFLLEDPEDGTHTFSRSLSEHNEAYRLYIKQE